MCSGLMGEYIITHACVDTESTSYETSTSTHKNKKCAFEFCIPQSNEAEYSGNSTVEQQSTTLFLEEKPVIAGTAMKTTSVTSTYIEELTGIKDFLAKPQVIATGQWTTATVANGSLTSFSVADQLSKTIWARKVEGFAMMKADFIVTVQINASPFQQGRLLLHYLPCLRDFLTWDSHYEGKYCTSLVQKAQHPHITIDCQDTVVKFRIPYVAPSHYYDFKTGKYDWGKVYLDVYSALLTGPAAVSTFVDYIVYGHWENVELIAPTYPQGDNRSKNRNVVSETAENSGPISSGLKKVGKVANVLKGVPLISDVATSVEWASNIASGIAGVLGWSKPRELQGQTVVVNQTLRYAGTSDGPDIAIPGGIISNNRVETIDYASYTNEDEMSMKYLLQIPVYNGEFTWNSTDPTDAALYTLSLKPDALYFTGYQNIGTHTGVFQMGGPIFYLARMFKQWRGGIKLTLKFIKTKMHSGRVMVTWTPGTNTPNAPDLDQSTYAMRTIVDIRDDNEVTIELPFLIYQDYIHSNEQSGKLQIRVVNQLRGPESVSQSIAVQMFYSACEDFELAVPNSMKTHAVVFAPQGDETSKTMHGVLGGSEINDSVIGGAKVSSEQLLHSTRCIGEKVLSIKSLLLRNSSLIGFSNFDLAASTNVIINPYTIASMKMVPVTGNYATPRIGGDCYNYLVPMYAFFRGGVRWTLTGSANTTAGIKSGCYPAALTDRLDSENILDNSTQAYTTNMIYNKNAVVVTTPTVQWVIEPTNRHDVPGVIVQHVPYYNKFPTSLAICQDGAVQLYTEPSQPRGAVCFSSSAAFADCTLQRAVCDDFQCSFFIGCPPVLLSYT